MFEQETDLIITTATQRVIGTHQESVAVKEILGADIPSPLKVFFRADVEMMLMEELTACRKKSRFNFNHPEVQHFQQQINSIVVLNYSFARERFINRMNDAVHMIINYLVRPQWTLINVLFEREQIISTPSLLRLLRYFGPYEYLKDLISRYIEDQQITTFTKPEFSSFLWKVDGAFVRRKTGDELARLLYPLYEFFDYPKKTGTNALPGRALMRYFEDKGLTSVILRVDHEMTHGNSEITRVQLSDMLEDVRRTGGAFEIEQIELPTTVGADQHLPSAVSIQPEELASGGTTLPKRVVEEPMHRSLLEHISEGDRKRFIKKIFQQDELAFEATIKKMENVRSWKDASRHVDEMLIKYEIDPYSSDAERFVEVLYELFHQRK